MDPDTIFNKTDRGREELKSRSLKLPMAARMLLVLSDGAKNLGALSRQCPSGTDVDAAVTQLLELGLIEAVYVPEVYVAPREAAPRPAAQPRRPITDKYVYGAR